MRVLTFGDNFGVPQLWRLLPTGTLIGVVGAQIRPQYFNLLKTIAAECSVPFIIQPKPASMTYPDFVEQVRILTPDLIIVNSYSMLLLPEILSIPRYGAVNVHGALLPQYRGSNPLQWVLLNNESETGVTLHYMDANFDTGDIIAQRRVPIYFDETWRDIQARIIETTEVMLTEELPKLLTKTNSHQLQEASKAHYYKRRRPEDGLIDWQLSVLYLYNLIRALVRPYPGAFYLAGTEQIILDEYLTLAQVTTLKYGTVGAQILQTKHVRLIPIRFEDLPYLAERLNNHIRTSLNVAYNRVKLDRQPEWFEIIQLRNDVLIFTLSLAKTDQIIGFCQLQNISPTHLTAELQLHISEIFECEDDCIADIVRVLLNFAYSDLNLRRVYAHLPTADGKTIRIYEKIGFKHEGQLRQATFIDSIGRDVTIVGILRDDFYVE